MIRSVVIIAGILGLTGPAYAQAEFVLGSPALAVAPCNPNPNLVAPPFVDGCSLPAAPLNGLATIASPTFSGTVSLSTLAINSPAGLNNPAIINENLSGTVINYQGPPNFAGKANGQYAGSYISAVNNSLAANGSVAFVTPFWVDYSLGGPTVSGNQSSAIFTVDVTAPTNSAVRSTRFYSPIYMNAYMSANDGGTGVDGIHSAGVIQGGSATVSAVSGATNLLNIEGWELDVAVNTGASVWVKDGLSIAALGSDAVHGTHEAMIDLGGQAGSIGWNNAIVFNDWHGAPPLSASGCVLCTDGASHTIGTGVDLSSYTISGNAWKTPGLTVTGAGKIVNTGAPTSCSGQPTGTLWNNAGVASFCP